VKKLQIKRWVREKKRENLHSPFGNTINFT